MLLKLCVCVQARVCMYIYTLIYMRYSLLILGKLIALFLLTVLDLCTHFPSSVFTSLLLT